MKVILTARRNPELDRPGFFRHLRQVHWPLVRGFPGVLKEILRYQQNHTLLPDEEGDESGAVATPWRRAVERDSVIEVWFDGLEGLQRMDADPDYVAHVRPDEARFNALAGNVMLLADEQVYHDVARRGRLRRFDFLYRAEGCEVAQFQDACRTACEDLALDPAFQALADAQSLHLPHSPDSGGAAPDAVLMTAASGMDALTRLAARRFVAGFQSVTDQTRSFSVVATAFPIHPPKGD